MRKHLADVVAWVFPPVQPVPLFHTDMSVYITNTFKWSPAAAVPQFAGKHRPLCTRWTVCEQFSVENISSAMFSARAIRAATVTLLWGERDGNDSQGCFFLGGQKKLAGHCEHVASIIWAVTNLVNCWKCDWSVWVWKKEKWQVYPIFFFFVLFSCFVFQRMSYVLPSGRIQK